MNIIYLRASTKLQQPEIQLEGILDSFRINEYSIFTEKQSAYKENVKREEFQKVINLIKAGNVSDIYVWDLDRLYRNRKRLKDFFSLCQIHQTKVHSRNQDWLESINQIPKPFDDIIYELLLNIMGWIGEEESQKKSARIKNAVVKKEGQKTKSYRGNKWGRKKSLSTQAEKKLIEMRNSGMSIREIADNFVFFDKNRNPKNLSKSAVHKLLAQLSR